MLTSRSIPPDLWEQARRALVFYFSRRHGFTNAEDLAHDTLQAVWIREDFIFEKEEQFLRVCYGFASRVSLEGHRQVRRNAAISLDSGKPVEKVRAVGLSELDTHIFVEDVRRVAESRLTSEDWEMVRLLMEDERESAAGLWGNANMFRVRLHRVRGKLAELTGWTAGKKKA